MQLAKFVVDWKWSIETKGKERGSHGQPADHLRITWELSPGCLCSKLQEHTHDPDKGYTNGKASVTYDLICKSDGDGDWFGVFWESLSQKKTRAIAMATPIVVAAIKNPVIMVGDSDGDDDVD